MAGRKGGINKGKISFKNRGFGSDFRPDFCLHSSTLINPLRWIVRILSLSSKTAAREPRSRSSHFAQSRYPIPTGRQQMRSKSLKPSQCPFTKIKRITIFSETRTTSRWIVYLGPTTHSSLTTKTLIFDELILEDLSMMCSLPISYNQLKFKRRSTGFVWLVTD